MISLFLWLNADAAVDLTLRVPTERDLAEPEVESTGPIRGQLINFGGQASDLPGAWPRFRGANFDAISDEDISLARSWPESGPEVLWSLDVGEGYASAAVLNGRVYIIDYDHEKEADVIRCLSLDTGQDIWQYSYPIKVKRYHGMSRTIPAVTENYIVTIGPKCHVTCLDSTTGEFKWMMDLVGDFGTQVPEWYAGQCPIIDDDNAIIAPGGDDVLMMAVDCETGEIVWQTPNPNGWKMTHSSIMPVEFMSVKMYVYCASEGVAGVSAETGEILWEYDDWSIRQANISAPLDLGDGRIFLSGGYNAGSMILQLAQENDRIVPQPVFQPQFNIELSFQQGLDNGIVSDQLRKELRGNEIILSTEGVMVTIEEPENRWLIADGKKRYLIRKEQQELVFCTTRLKPAVFGSEQHTPILYRGHIFGIRPDKRLVCLDLEGNVVWDSSDFPRFGNSGLGPYSIADGKIYILDDEGLLTMAEASTSGYKQLAQAQVIEDGFDAWGPMAFASGRLILRDMYKMICLDISEK
ncbi:PQQ-binding-like beta-propeller repeat protein [Planctomycetota bacterium]